MPLHLTHLTVRGFARNLRELTGRSVRHTSILEDIAASIGQKPDAMMHRLKQPSDASDPNSRQPILCIDERAIKTIARRLNDRATRPASDRVIDYHDVVLAIPCISGPRADKDMHLALTGKSIVVIDLLEHMTDVSDPVVHAGRRLGELILENEAYEAYCTPAAPGRPSLTSYKTMKKDVKVPKGLSLAETMLFIHRASTIDDPVDRSDIMDVIIEHYVSDRSKDTAFQMTVDGVPGLMALRCQWEAVEQTLLARCLLDGSHQRPA